MSIPFNKVKKKQIIERYIKGERVIELAKEYGISMQTIYIWTNDVQKENQTSKFMGITEEEVAKFKTQQDNNFIFRYNK